MSTMNFLLSILGWTFIPDLATNHLLKFVYHSPIPIVAPQQGSLQHRKYYAIAYGLVVISYLTYTLVQSSQAMQPNFYEILGVRPDVDENGLKLAFRAFAKRYHPDKAGPQGKEMFMYVRDAFEALKDPVVRFAYDRFGPEAVAWRHHCKTTRQFLKQGLLVSSGYHIVTGIALLFWSAIGKPSAVSFWRYILFALLFAAELSFILASFPAAQTTILQPSESFLSFSILPTPLPTILTAPYPTFQRIWPNRVPYQHILFLHQIFVFLSVALTRVAPRFISLLGHDGTDGKPLEPFEVAVWERIYGTIAVADREASLILHTILQSVTPDNDIKSYHDPSLALMRPLSPERTRETLDSLTHEMHAMVVEANIKNHTSRPIARAWQDALTSQNSDSKSMMNGSPVSDSPTPPTPRSVKEKEGVEVIHEVVDNLDSSSSRPESRDPMLTPLSTTVEVDSTVTVLAETSSPRSSLGASAGTIIS